MITIITLIYINRKWDTPIEYIQLFVVCSTRECRSVGRKWEVNSHYHTSVCQRTELLS